MTLIRQDSESPRLALSICTLQIENPPFSFLQNPDGPQSEIRPAPDPALDPTLLRERMHFLFHLFIYPFIRP